MTFRSILILLFTLLQIIASSQSTYKPPQVFHESKGLLKHPWAGGMNACQFNEVDMNMDGIKDLLVFDRQGNRLMPFLNTGNNGINSYQYAPAFAELFPEIKHWILMEDYDNDGLNDIFTYNKDNPGMMVYKNISQEDLKFELVVYPYLTSEYGSGEVNILVTMVDYPGIADLDNDGDLDILTFWALGTFVERHKNMSMELYGHADSLVYERVEYCWGFFGESEESNEIYLDTCFGQVPTRDRHTGSTFLTIDLDGDSDKDLLLGDVDYPDLFMLENGGDPEEAYMISFTNEYPFGSEPIKLFSLPLGKYIDVTNDGLPDLLVSPFDANPYVVEDHNSSWLYINSGTYDTPEFTLYTKGFLQNDMIDVGSGSYICLADFNNDALTDLIIGNYGKYESSWYDDYMILHSEYAGQITVYKNIGTPTNPVFEFVADDFAYVSHLGLNGIYPAFGDVDGDFDPDMIVGTELGNLLLFTNCSCIGNIDDYVLEDTNYHDIDVGKYSTPFVVDLNGDNLNDLVIGEKNGNLNYFRNDGTMDEPIYTFVTDSLGKINVTDYSISNYGFSTPWFFKNQDDELELLVGSEQGKIFYFTNIEGNLEGEFEESDSLYKLVQDSPLIMPTGFRTSAAIHDINNNGYMDLLIGNFSGGLNYFPDIDQPGVSGIETPHFVANDNINIYPNPVSETAMIRYRMPDEGYLMIDIYSISGRRIRRIAEEKVMPGVHEIEYDVSDLPNGVYFIRLQAGDEILVRKLIVR
ncbi:MAG: T9SS type A sorting domain-containing protein [Bacteroidota bacterium]|nr:T9SS type A sorting domain-containing protein [Bacteroidota bacterium]